MDLQSRERALAQNISHGTHGLDEVQGCTGVKAASRVVEAEHTSTGGHHLGNRHPLALTTRNTPHEFVSDVGILGVRDVQHF